MRKLSRRVFCQTLHHSKFRHPDADKISGNSIQMSEDKIQIGVAVVTRGRPNMLSDLLESWVALKIPDGASLHFIIVENDPAGTVGVAKAVSLFKDNLATSQLLPPPPPPPPHVHFTVEPQLGIPYARNAALGLATDIGCDFLVFTDDDCRVDPDWLNGLLLTQRAGSADLVCGIVRYTADWGRCNFIQRALARDAIETHEAWRERCRYVDIEKCNKAPIGTGYWMIRMAFVESHRLRFDERLGFSAGEDIRFYNEMLAAGGSYATDPGAHVEETLTEDRLTLKYRFMRARSHRIAIGGHERRGLCRGFGTSFLGLVTLPFCLSRMPFDKGRSFVRGINRIGLGVGSIEYALGRRQTSIYRTTTGE